MEISKLIHLIGTSPARTIDILTIMVVATAATVDMAVMEEIMVEADRTDIRVDMIEDTTVDMAVMDTDRMVTMEDPQATEEVVIMTAIEADTTHMILTTAAIEEDMTVTEEVITMVTEGDMNNHTILTIPTTELAILTGTTNTIATTDTMAIMDTIAIIGTTPTTTNTQTQDITTKEFEESIKKYIMIKI